MELLESQKAAFNEILEWWHAGKESGLTLTGRAGVGKTTLIKFLCANIHTSIALTAPTNKATKIIRELDTGKDCMTIYSLLGLRMVENEDVLVLEKAERSLDTRYRLVVLDEGSQVGSNLVQYIQESMGRGVRYLVCMDRKQLNPIGEHISPLWKMFRRVVMNKVIRHDNQILKLSTHVRRAKSFNDIPFRSDNDKYEGVWYLPERKFDDRLCAYADLGLFSNESTRLVAWRNKTVDKYNKIIRGAIYKKEAAANPWMVGENAIITQPYEDENVTLHTDDESVINTVAVGPHQYYEEILCYHLGLKVGNQVHTVKTLHEQGVEKYFELLAQFAETARTKDKREWAKYWTLKNSVVSIRYAYALTAHRIQGSTVKNAFVDISDIACNHNTSEALKAFYVGQTRPTTKLFLK